jgi:DNA-3-methyladenine glycosylase II
MASSDLDAQNAAALRHLASADPVMADLIERWGPLHLTRTDEYFFTLVDAIVAQQLSSKAANTIVGRVRTLVPGKDKIAPDDILAIPEQSLRDAGLSWSKVSYIKDLAGHVASGQLHLGRISEMDDESIIQELVAVKGIGRWTAEMFLIFSLARPDVLAVDDLGLRTAMKRLYDFPDLPKPAPMRELAEPWRPYRSYASLYLWRNADNSPKVAALEG